MIARVPGKPAGCSWRGFYFERSPDTWIHPPWVQFYLDYFKPEQRATHFTTGKTYLKLYFISNQYISKIPYTSLYIHLYIHLKVYSKLDFPRCSKHGAVAVGVLESPVCVRDDKRNLRDHVRETFMGWWSKSTLSSCRRTRSGISVSFKPSTVKWFSASLRDVM